MSDGTKSVILFCGIAAFFALMVVGPLIGNRLDDLVTWGAEISNETNPNEFDKQRQYAGTPLAKAHDCCTGACSTAWDYDRDVCDPGSQTANECLLNCVSAPAKPAAPATH